MEFDPTQSDAAYLALAVRDARFDGHWFVGVRSTGVYCRPVCRVRTPGRAQCRFFSLAAQAEHAGFRPCLKCRPELAGSPGWRWSTMDAPAQLARQALDLLRQEAPHGARVQALADRLGVSARHFHRLIESQYGIGPQEALNTHRLLVAKQWLTDTRLNLEEVARLSGFGSARRMGEMFRQRYRLSPERWRQQQAGQGARHRDAGVPGDCVALTLQARAGWREDTAWAFRLRRALPGVEALRQTGAQRDWTLALPAGILASEAPAGVLRLSWVVPPELPQAEGAHAALGVDGHEGGDAGAVAEVAEGADAVPELAGLRPRTLQLMLPASLWPWMPEAIALVRRVWDLDAPQTEIDRHLADWPGRPGVLLPGAPDPFELLVRAVLGQQVTVAAARTLCRRLMERHGQPMASPWPEVSQAFPRAQQLATMDVDAWRAMGVMPARGATLVALVQAWPEHERLWREAASPLGGAAARDAWLAALEALPGIGPWTARYILLRTLSPPDLWLPGDVALLQSLWQRQPARLGSPVARPVRWTKALERALADDLQRASPWRSYLVMRLWDAAAEAPLPSAEAAGADAGPALARDAERGAVQQTSAQDAGKDGPAVTEGAMAQDRPSSRRPARQKRAVSPVARTAPSASLEGPSSVHRTVDPMADPATGPMAGPVAEPKPDQKTDQKTDQKIEPNTDPKAKHA